MKKTLLAVSLLTLGMAFQAQAANTAPKQSPKPEQTTAVQVESGQTVKGSPVQEQTKVMNQGEVTQVQTQNGVENVAGKGNANGTATQKRSMVANAVQAMLQLADRNGGIGQQVKTIAQNQNQNQVKLEKNIEKIESRGAVAKFFVGPNYGEIKDSQKTLEQNREQIRQLNQIKTQLSNEGDQQQLTEQIKILEQANQEIESVLQNAQEGVSLFGWLNKLLS
ncbi:MAG TPA: hypothetical protein DEA43_02345 [Candidatus Moranbacteria bacterium]|nr:hypothetical protein [Candidatus Moranbacteria bacterium]HBT45705.1 hypothetical protein [Candidatus Moranbacteria bacterium]